MSRWSLRDFLYKHIEKIIVAGVVIAIAAYGISIAASPTEASQLSRQAQDTITRIEKAQENAESPLKAKRDFLPELKEAFIEVPESGREPAWFAFKRPYALRRVEFISQPKPQHFPPLLEAKPDVGQVELKWSESDKNENIGVKIYELYRRDPGGAWKKIGEFGPEENTCTDTGLEHEENYTYKLISIAEREEGAAQFDNSEDTRKESEPVTIKTRFNFDVRITSWAPGYASGKIVVLKPGGGQEDKPFSWRVGDSVVIDGKDTGWIVEKIGEKSITMKKGIRVKTFDR